MASMALLFLQLRSLMQAANVGVSLIDVCMYVITFVYYSKRCLIWACRAHNLTRFYFFDPAIL